MSYPYSVVDYSAPGGPVEGVYTPSAPSEDALRAAGQMGDRKIVPMNTTDIESLLALKNRAERKQIMATVAAAVVVAAVVGLVAGGIIVIGSPVGAAIFAGSLVGSFGGCIGLGLRTSYQIDKLQKEIEEAARNQQPGM